MYRKIKSFIENWVYPAYYLKNVLFHRYDLVKLPQIKPYEYFDVPERILYANFELLCHFVEKEHPFDVVDMYFHTFDNSLLQKLENNEISEEEFAEIAKNDPLNLGNIVKECYNYWRVVRPALDEKFKSENMDTCMEIMKTIEEKDEYYLSMIMKVRNHLWT